MFQPLPMQDRIRGRKPGRTRASLGTKVARRLGTGGGPEGGTAGREEGFPSVAGNPAEEKGIHSTIPSRQTRLAAFNSPDWYRLRILSSETGP